MGKDRTEYNKQYYEAHKEEKKKYYEEHKEHYKQYREAHKEEIKKYHKDRKEYYKQYYEAHKEEKQKYYEEYYKVNLNKIQQRNKKYNDTHKDERKQYNIDYRKNSIINPEGYTIYCYINKLNGKRYIGKTKQMLRFRKRDGYRDNKELNYILQKYGWDLFDTEILLSGLTSEEATYFEKKLIKIFNTTDSNYGYNKQVG